MRLRDREWRNEGGTGPARHAASVSPAMINRVYGCLGTFPHRSEGVEYIDRPIEEVEVQGPAVEAIG